MVYHPVDLLYLSGIISEEHDIEVLDCMAQRIGFQEAAKIIDKLSPDAVVFLTGHVSWREDIDFLWPLREEHGFLLIGTGDILLESSGKKLSGDRPLDAVILDFTTDDILHYLRGEHHEIRYMHYRAENGVSVCSIPRQKVKGFSLPIPRFEKFPMREYRFSLVRRLPFGTVLTDYGCPFKCSFCLMGNIRYKTRSVENVIEELDVLRSMGTRDIFFIDQTFGADWKRTEELLREMIKREYGFGFVCLTRADLLDEDRVELMTGAGCHTVIMGVETAGENTLEEVSKGSSVEEIRKGFSLAEKAGLRTVATYILGLPGESLHDCMKTLDLALELNTDFASFNVPVPRENTRLREQALKNGWFEADNDFMDQSGTVHSMGTGKLSDSEILKFRSYAIARFYGRPSYILKRIVRMKTIYELKTMLFVGLNILKSLSIFNRK